MSRARRSRSVSVISPPESWRHILTGRADSEQFLAPALLKRQREGRTLELARSIQQLDQRRGLTGLPANANRAASELQRVDPGWRSQQLSQFVQSFQIFAGLLPEIVQCL